MQRAFAFIAALVTAVVIADVLLWTAEASPKEREHDQLETALSKGLQLPSHDVLEQIKRSGARVSPLQVGGTLVQVNFLDGVSKCTDDSVAALAPIKENIAHLDLARTSVTDQALRTAGTFPRLTHLDLRKTKITDRGLEALSASRNLESINLFGTEVSDAGLDSLGKIKSLRKVYLFETKVTAAGVAKLREALPRVEVVSDLAHGAPSSQRAPRRR